MSSRLISAHPLALEEHCAAVQRTGQTQVLVSRAATSFAPDRVHLPNVQAPTCLRELDSPRSEKIICIGKVSLARLVEEDANSGHAVVIQPLDAAGNAPTKADMHQCRPIAKDPIRRCLSQLPSAQPLICCASQPAGQSKASSLGRLGGVGGLLSAPTLVYPFLTRHGNPG